LSKTENQLQTGYQNWLNARDAYRKDLALRAIESAAEEIIKSETRRYYGYDYAELRQVARIAIWRSLPKFNPSIPRATLSSYIKMVVYSALATHTVRDNDTIKVPHSVLKSKEQRFKMVTLPDPDLSEEACEPIWISDPDTDIERDVIERDVIELVIPSMIDEMLTHVNDHQRRVMRLKLVDDLTYIQIAERTGLSIKQIDNAMTNAYRKLRKRYKTPDDLSWA
jgi:RNA polymerase sigma factor (sigma-70 family)